MPAPTFQEELAVFGPAAQPMPLALPAAQAYCRAFARRHYENFSVASLLLPRPLRQHFYNIYAYCRWADNLADEAGDQARSLDLLRWWETELDRCYAGQATHPVFVALQATIDEFAIPASPFRDLLVAFRRDQSQTRYATFEQLLEYCRYSANPVGHLVLFVGRSHSPQTARLSDSICSGLQLANHWQDVARDFQNGRVYLPQEDRRRCGVDEAMLVRGQASPEFRQLVQQQVDRAERMLRDGGPLAGMVAPALRRQIRLFQGGGLAILNEIRRANYDVLARRPTVSRWQQARLLAGVWLSRGDRA